MCDERQPKCGSATICVTFKYLNDVANEQSEQFSDEHDGRRDFIIFRS